LNVSAAREDRFENRSDISLTHAVLQALQDVKDPEMPVVSLVELGMVYEISVENRQVSVKLLPTFVGCPATQIMRQQVSDRLQEIEGIDQVDVTFVMDIPWTSDRITEEGREKLINFGIAPPKEHFLPRSAPTCCYCGSNDTETISLFGPTACRSVYYCKTCKQPFEGMKFI
jgi:ring-1,2-phenylacetyl-CoA epoxidase subunit PaaD